MRWAAGPRGPLALAGLALLLALPSVTLGPMLDDHGFRRRLSIEGRGPAETFCFGDPSGEHRARHGPWWSVAAPARRCFMRPLSGVTHWVDYRLWPDAVWWMRLENCLLYAVLVALAAAGYRRLDATGATAALAGIMFAIDEAHAHSLSMIAARNTLLCAALGLLALLAHHAQRSAPSLWRVTLGPTAFALALLAGEGALGTLGYLAAYALCIDRSPAAERGRSLFPYFATALIWGSGYVAFGYGMGGGAFYRNPRTDPVGTLAQGALDLPVWLATVLGPGFATMSFEAGLATVRFVSLLACALLAWLLWPTLRASPTARFYGLGSLLSVLPLLLTVAQDRLLTLASFGGFGLLACFFPHAGAHVGRRTARWVLLAIHVGLAPIAFLPTYLLAGRIARAETKVDQALPQSASAARIGVVIVRAPVPGTLPYALSKRLGLGQILPRYSYELYVAPSALEVLRIDERTLELAPSAGFCSSRSECIANDPAYRFRVGQRIELSDMRVEVRSRTARGMPQRVRFQFSSPLEDPSRRWLSWTAQGLQPFTPPALQQSLRLGPLSRLDPFR